MIRVNFKEPQQLYFIGELMEKVKHIYCEDIEIDKKGKVFLILSNEDYRVFYASDVIQSIEHVKPTDL